MAVQKQDDQHEHTFSSYVRIRDVVLKTCLGRWTIGRSGERGSGISVLPARHDDDDDYHILLSYYYNHISLYYFNYYYIIIILLLLLSLYYNYHYILLYYYYYYITIICYPLIGLVGRVFANGPRDLGSIPGRVTPKTWKMVLDASLLNIQQYKVRTKGKVEESRERRSALPYTSV